MPRFLLAALLALAPFAGAGAQELSWERLGDHAFSRRVLTLDPKGELWAGGTHLWRLDLSSGLPGIWIEVQHIFSTDQLHFLTPDDVLALRFDRVERSVDRGETWTEVYSDDGGTEMLFEVPPGHPYAGTLFAHTRSENPLRSTDRGATWSPPSFSTGIDDNEVQAMIAVPDGPWPPGRLVAGGYYGITVSDDGGASFAPVHPWEFLRYRSYGFASVAGPAGTPRLLALVVENTQPDLRIWASDDGGTTWAHLSSVPATDAKAMGSLGGSAALLVTSEGNVWRTNDAGVTWDVIGRVPDTDEGTSTRPNFASVLADGRLYVSLRGANGTEWVWRTADRIAVASADGPPWTSGSTLTVRPNPGGDTAASLRLSAPAHARVSVYDVLGREVAVVADRSFEPGEHTLRLAWGLAPGTYIVRAEVSASGAARVLVRTFTVVR